MSRTNTSRLKLIEESDDELIDQFDYNWSILDTYSGGLIVADGVTPPDSSLYDGCLVTEATSGKMWIAMKNQVGGYNKQWVIYPWSIALDSGGISIPVAAPGASRGWTIFTPTDCVNTGAADLDGSNRVKVPIDGIYATIYNIHHVPDPDNAFGAYLLWNGVADDRTYTAEPTTNNGTAIYTYTGVNTLKAADTVGWRVDLFGSSNVMSCKFWMSLISPL